MIDIERQKLMRKAVRVNDQEQFFKLLGEGNESLHETSVFGSWLHFAASHGCLAIVKRLIEMGLDPNKIGGVHNGGALHLAASEGHLDVVKFLLDSGAVLDVSKPESNPLFGAIHGGHTAIAKLLIDSGIDTQVRYSGESMKDMDALAFAREWGRSDIVELLQVKGRQSGSAQTCED